MTAAGYPYIVKRLRRGQPLAAATEVFRGRKSDVGAGSVALHDGEGHRVMFVQRYLDFFTTEVYLVGTQGLRKLALPAKVEIGGMVAGRVLFEPKESWSVDGTVFPAGSLVAVELTAMLADPAHLKPRARICARSARVARGSGNDEVARSRDDVRKRQRPGSTFTSRSPAAAGVNGGSTLPDNSAIGLVTVDKHDDQAFLYVSGFFTPPALELVDAATGSVTTAKTATARFDASRDVVEQLRINVEGRHEDPVLHRAPQGHEAGRLKPDDRSTRTAASKFLRRRTIPACSGNCGSSAAGCSCWPTSAAAASSVRPGTKPALKTHRQVASTTISPSVAQDLIARKITSPRRLGIQGGSNGGLLMGVEFTQHPELFNAVDIQVPLLDMLRYEQIAAGASWVGEYGSVSNPAERAFLASISPYKNLRAGVKYPEPLIWTTTKDDRVGPRAGAQVRRETCRPGCPLSLLRSD